MIDTHAHLHLIDRPVADIFSAAKDAGVTHIVQVAIDMPSIETNISLYQTIDGCSITGGIHPLSVTNELELDPVMAYLDTHIDAFLAIGETGLDYKYGSDNKKKQHLFFEAQLEFAQRHNKPVVIHSRHSDDDMLAIVNQYPDVKKVFHCYATNYDFFEALEGDLNYVSFTGMVTYAKKGKVINAMKRVPINRLMIETDAPYMIPQGVDAQQNSPEYVGQIAAHIAKCREMFFDDVVSQTTQNSIDFFGESILF